MVNVQIFLGAVPPFFANWPVFSRLKTHEQATKDIIWLSI